MNKLIQIVLLVFGSFVLLTVNAQDVCTKTGPCSCEFSNGTGIDLSPSTKSSFYMTNSFQLKNNGTQYEMSTFYYHPCHDVLPNTTIVGTCRVPLSIYRHKDMMNLQPDNSYKYEGTCEFLGTSNVTEFSADGKSIIYQNGPSSTLVMLICAETIYDEVHVHSLAEPNKIQLAFYSTNACMRELEPHVRSFGTTLLIIFFSFVLFYLVLRICTKNFLMGATGVEVVPNLSFWMDLPNFVKDGNAFALNGFKLPARGPGPMASPDPNRYDII